MYIKTINLKREWNFVVSEMQRRKPKMNSLLKKELFFIIQNLLITISSNKFKYKEKMFLQEIYLKAKSYYFEI